MTADANDIVWERFRARMPVAANVAYFDHAAIAPLSGPAREAMAACADDFAGHGVLRSPPWRRKIEETRKKCAALIGSAAEEIALVGNTTQGISLVAECFPWQAGDNMVVPECEFPSNLYPWENLAERGVELRKVPVDGERLDLDRVESLCDDRTRIVSASWVGYASGWRNDLRALGEIAHRRGALFFVDAIQGLGVLPVDVGELPIDFLAADGHKWLLGPEGAGLLFIRREHLPRLRTIGVGWNSVRHAGQYTNSALDLKDSAARYEGGSYNKIGFAGLCESLRLLLDIGVEALEQRLLDVTDRIVAELGGVGATIASCREIVDGCDRRSGIVSFAVPGVDPETARKHCVERGVALNTRAGRLRVSPHGYTSEADIDRLVESLVELRP